MVADKLNLQKRQHRERSQPANRAKLGLLEKHADYVKRARDFHSKEDRIQNLREKAAMRNKDEFYFGMINSRTKKGVHMQSRGNETLDVDLVKVLKTQDAGYVRTVLSSEVKRVERLQQKLNALLDATTTGAKAAGTSGGSDDEWDDFDLDEPVASTSQRKHIVFTDDLDAVRSATDPSSILPKKPLPTTPRDSSDAPLKRSRKGKAKATSLDAPDPALLAAESAAAAKAAAKYRAQLEEELAAREGRVGQLRRAMREVEVQRMLMGKGAKQAVVAKRGSGQKERDEMNWEAEGKGKGNKGLPEADEGIATGARVWKWKQERKR